MNGRRFGGTSVGLLSTILGAVGLVTAAAVIGPRYLRAQPAEAPPTQVARDPDHQQIIELLARLLQHSHRIVAIHDRGASPLQEVVLWMTDNDDAGAIGLDEVAVVAHSEIARTLELWTLSDPGDDAPAVLRQLRAPGAGGAATALTIEDLSEARFGRRWRTSPFATHRVIGRGVSIMQIRAAEDSPEGTSLMEISLSWPADTADGPDKASVHIDVGTRPMRAP